MEIKADGAIPADQIARDAATGAHAVNLMDAEMSADIQLAPCFDEDGAFGFVGKEKFKSRTFVFDVDDRRCGLEGMIIQAGRLKQTSRGQFSPSRCDDPYAHPRVETGGGVLS